MLRQLSGPACDQGIIIRQALLKHTSNLKTVELMTTGQKPNLKHITYDIDPALIDA